eukprot:5117336-Prymnesium_polylepis.1
MRTKVRSARAALVSTARSEPSRHRGGHANELAQLLLVGDELRDRAARRHVLELADGGLHLGGLHAGPG